MKIAVFNITGLSPMLQHSPASMLVTSGGDGLKAKRKNDPKAEAEAGVYRNDKGEVVIPTIAFRSAILSAAKGRKIGKVAAKTVISGCVFPVEESTLLLDQKAKPLSRYKVHTCRAVIQRAGVIRARPMFENWTCRLALEVDVEMMPNLSILTELLNIAGKIIGIGDWRPEKLGTFGRFKAELR